MLGANVSPLTSYANGFECRDCSKRVPKTGHGQIRCKECAHQRRRSTLVRWRERKGRGEAQKVGDTFTCECGESVRRTGGGQKYCAPCGVAKKKLTSNAEAYRRRKGTSIVKGAIFPCALCGCDVVRCGAGHTFCGACNRNRTNDRQKTHQARLRLARGVRPTKGTTITCGLCGSVTQRNGIARRYCDDCGPNLWKKCPTKSLNLRIGNQIRASLEPGSKRRRKWCDLVGYSLEQLQSHLERQFQKGMTWENRGEWHIDHITPLSSFKYESPEDPEFKAAWALTNLRPLWAKENLQKSAKRTFLL